MLPPIYSKAVLDHYRRRAAIKDLSIDVMQLSPASLKAACVEACKERFDRKDGWVLEGFFGEGGDFESCVAAIGGTPIDRFRPLAYFLKGRTKNPDDKIVEVVAWLIDFKPRPYDPTVDYSIVTVPVTKPDDGPEPPIVVSGKKNKKRKRFILAITVSIAFGMSFFLWPRKPVPPPIDGQACMFWTGDHYQPISCREKVENAQVVALDTALLYHFQKITRPDTITQNAVGHVWYAHYRGNYEFYTANGPHPLNPDLRLLPITPGIVIHRTPTRP